MSNFIYKSPFNLASWYAGLAIRILPSSWTTALGWTGALPGLLYIILIRLSLEILGTLRTVPKVVLFYNENCTFGFLTYAKCLSDIDLTTFFAFKLRDEGFLLCRPCRDVITYINCLGEEISRRVPRKSSGFGTSCIKVLFAILNIYFSSFSRRFLILNSDFARLSCSLIQSR